MDRSRQRDPCRRCAEAVDGRARCRALAAFVRGEAVSADLDPVPGRAGRAATVGAPLYLPSVGMGTISSGVAGSATLSVTAAKLQTIIVTPANSSVPTRTVLTFTATGNYSDRTTKNLALVSTWSSSNTAVANHLSLTARVVSVRHFDRHGKNGQVKVAFEKFSLATGKVAGVRTRQHKAKRAAERSAEATLAAISFITAGYRLFE